MLVEQPFQGVDLLDPIVRSKRDKIHSNQVFRIVILDTLQRCKLARKGFSISVIYSVRSRIAHTSFLQNEYITNCLFLKVCKVNFANFIFPGLTINRVQ